MDDKKEYKKMIKALDATASVSSTLNKLNEIAVDAEDQKIKQAAVGIASRLREMARHFQGDPKIRLLTFSANCAMAAEPERKALSAGITATLEYCTKCIAVNEPQWMILARNAGWTPPAA